jgi:sugar phosphate isomerase/epimerase
MITRRQLIQKAALFAAAGRFASATPARTQIQLGAQTNAWAIDPARFDTFLGVLDQVKKIGYTGFETGFFNVRSQFKSPETARNSIAKSGLIFFGIHIAISLERSDPRPTFPRPSFMKKSPTAVLRWVRSGSSSLVGISAKVGDYSNGQQVPLGRGTFPLAQVAATLEHLNWQGWALNEEERENGSKLGLTVMEPAFAALQKAFPQ